ncbi:MAG: N-acetylmuramoyl-L-alanine amidase [Brevinematales bacterium]|nr:N-acetylmuramoyl-L-alanine amidase [Brevinematales bacterium]
MRSIWRFLVVGLCYGLVVAGVSLEEVAGEYGLSLRYDWNLGYGELKSENTNRFCRVYFNMPYVIVDGRVYYFEEGVGWETNGRLVLSPLMEKVVKEFARDVKNQRSLAILQSNFQRNSETNQIKEVFPQNTKPLSVVSNALVSNRENLVSREVKTNQITSSTGKVTTNRIEQNTNKETAASSQQTPLPGGRDLFRPIKTVILDPGHGGKDPGGIGKGGIKEKEIVLQLAQSLKEALENMGYRVLLTRSLDRYVSLSERVELAYDRWNGGEGAIFVSIHGNISLNPRIRGIEVYYLSDKASDAGASAVEIAENAGFSMDDVKHTEGFYSVLNVLMREGVSKVSKALAKDVKIALESQFSRVSVKSANFYVLRFSPLPAILWEIGYLSHAEEGNQLTSQSYQRQLAKFMASGLDRFIRRYNARRGNI